MDTHASFEHWLQSRLTAHGFSPGPIDGIVGTNTRAAIAAFQRRTGLPVTEEADEVTVAALRLSSSVTADFKRPETPSSSRTVKQTFPRQRDVMSFYGPVGRNQVLVDVPWRMVLAWDKRRVARRMSLHEKVADSAARCMERTVKRYGQEGINELGLNLFGGSLNVRRMRGGSAYSMHSWGIAIDFDPQRNQLRWKHPRARLSQPDARPFFEIWEDEGWISLGRERDFDWMHLQAARL
ncbi:MAG: peptidoglycan-binding protein [Pseudomonadota bacterium]